MRWHDSQAVRAASLGAGLGLGAPLGLWGLGVLTGQLDQVPGWVFAYTAAATTVVFAGFGGWLGHRADQLEAAATHDPLTGLLNRGSLEAGLPMLTARSARDARSVAALMVDLDHFKRVNDRFGHPAGDRVLQAVASTLRAVCRDGDLVARYGGEEFVVVLPEADRTQALEIAERIRERVSQIDVDALGISGRLSASIGVATGVGPTPASIIAQADAAMYLAKRRGRDRVEVSTTTDARRVGG